jgi:hypothetical protein
MEMTPEGDDLSPCSLCTGPRTRPESPWCDPCLKVARKALRARYGAKGRCYACGHLEGRPTCKHCGSWSARRQPDGTRACRRCAEALKAVEKGLDQQEGEDHIEPI